MKHIPSYLPCPAPIRSFIYLTYHATKTIKFNQSSSFSHVSSSSFLMHDAPTSHLNYLPTYLCLLSFSFLLYSENISPFLSFSYTTVLLIVCTLVSSQFKMVALRLHFGDDQLVITLVGILGNIVSGMVYLAPLPTYYRIYKKKSTESFQSVPYVVSLFSAMLWLYYALLKTKEYYLLSINSAGCVIEAFYIVVYLAFASRTSRICTAKLFFSLNLVAFSMIVIIIQLSLSNPSRRVQVLGYICAIISIAVFAAPLSIMVRVIQTKSVEFMPFPLSFFLTLCAVIWFVYGLLRQDLFISIPNIFGFILGLLQMVLYTICKHCCFSKELQNDNPDNYDGKVITGVANNVDQNQIVDDKHQEQDHHQLETELDQAIGVETDLLARDQVVPAV